MALYVSVVEIAELVAIPQHHFGDGRATGPVGAQLLAIVWGTALGLALAHWFAFQVAAPAFRGDHITGHNARVGLAQVGGAVFVAAASSIPVLLFDDVRAQQLTGVVPAVIIGVVSYQLARARRMSTLAAVLYGIAALLLGVLVAVVKYALSGH
jgi:hypothetical protein